MKINGITISNKAIAAGLVFGVGLALALKSILLGIMFGIIFFVALQKEELIRPKKKIS